MTTYLAIDLGGTKISAALIKENIISDVEMTKTPSSNDPQSLISSLTSLLTPLAKKAEVVAVASTGIINKGVLTALNPKNLGGLDQFPIQSIIANITQLPTYVINDAQAAAWAEFKAHKEKYKNHAFITVSTGVGAGIIFDGNLLIGDRGIAGHAGHMSFDPLGPLCGCGRRGCIEAIASGTAIGSAGIPFFGNKSTGQFVYEQYLSGDERARDIIKTSARSIAELIANLTITLDIEAVSLGGSVGLAPHYLDEVQRYLSRLPVIYQPSLYPAVCEKNAGLIGVTQWVASTYSTGN